MGRAQMGRARPVSRQRAAAGTLESEVLAVLWAADAPLTPRGVLQALGRPLAYTTVMTILSRLHDKGAVGRSRSDGVAYAYSPVLDAAGLAAQRMRVLLDRGNDRAAVLSRFVQDLADTDDAALAEALRRLGVHTGADGSAAGRG